MLFLCNILRNTAYISTRIANVVCSSISTIAMVFLFFLLVGCSSSSSDRPAEEAVEPEPLPELPPPCLEISIPNTTAASRPGCETGITCS